MATSCIKALGVTIAKKKVNLSGIIIPLPTPFENNEKQTVHYEMLRNNIRKYEQIPLKGYCIGGTYGEGPYLKPEEKLSILRTVKSEIADNKILIAGTTCETTIATCELSVAAAEAGADAVMVFTPFYFRTKMMV